MLWYEEVYTSVKFPNHNMMLVIVVDKAANVDFVLACSHHYHTRIIWHRVSNFVHQNLGKPVVCFGDLNEIMYDKYSTSININKSHMRTFNSYVKQCGLFDLGFSGPANTWTNKRASLLLPSLRDLIVALLLQNVHSFS
jgi:hypothetical protein